MSITIEQSEEAAVAQVLFSDMPLAHEVQLAVQMTGYVTPTPVQAEIIPQMLAGRDVLAQSQTGTGKTAAFALPILSNIAPAGTLPQVLVLTPTRELALQVAKSFETYAACMPKLRVLSIYGGADYNPQLRALRQGVDVVVGTPGRVLDHMRRGTLKLDAIQCLVLDEADEMLNMGFQEDVEFVLSQSPVEKQVALFSATMPEPIRRIADTHLKDPVTITIRKKTLTADSIEQRCVFVPERNKLELLTRMLEIEDTEGVIVFTKTKDSTVRVADHLISLGIAAAALNGDLPQARRQRTVDQLKSGQLNVLVATDVAARGLDVQRISHVFNYDLPHDGESYVHRIGRTGRAGRTGVAVIFLTPQQQRKLYLIEKVTKQPIKVVDVPTAREVNLKRIERFKNQIGETIKAHDLSNFHKLVAEYALEADIDLVTIAAALAYQANGGRPLFVKDIPMARMERNERGDRRDKSERFERSERRPARRGEEGLDHGPRKPRKLGRPEQGRQRYQIAVGSEDGVRPGNIVGAVANEAGLSGNEIGPIDIRRNFTTIDLPAGLPEEVLDTLRRTWVSGKQLKIRLFVPKGRDDESGSSAGSGPRARKFPGKFPGKKFEKAGGKPFKKSGKKPKR